MRPVAVIPVAGAGTRLKPLTDRTPKPLLEVAGKPILAHILDQVAEAKPERVVLVVGPGPQGKRIHEYASRRGDLKIEHVVQSEPLGLGHAVAQAKDLVGGAPVLIVLGDTIALAPFARLTASGSSLGVREVDDPRRFGVAIVRDGRITELVEKPEHPVSNLALVGLYYLTNSPLLFQSLASLEAEGKRTRGELQLTDALQRMIEKGEELRPFPVQAWYDCGKTDTLLETNRALLDLHAGPVSRPGVVCLPPVALDPSADVLHSVIGPHTSIGPGARVRRAVVRNSIINQGATVEDVLLDLSVVGEKAVVRGDYRRLTVGESSEVEST
ncbi:MAG: nucleotidyl transferase [Candidatus Eisenbacteria bacterium]|uniref:Nucleotidyl transferase n=1 Tax=Eiseniibacteriota bacterium TaxID=2212470 RepID=A0A538TUE6_UNCEI|nr:MAG: nucleotidyl transferase [Candidatus Eisenbacteria bacterium]